MGWCVGNHRHGRLGTTGRRWVGLVSVKGMTGRKDLEQEELRAEEAALESNCLVGRPRREICGCSAPGRLRQGGGELKANLGQ